MPAEIQSMPLTWQRWPCGPECQYAQPLPNTYGDWHWCAHPYVGGKVARDGRECGYYQALSSLRSATTPPRWSG